MGVKHFSIRQSLQYVADHPDPKTDVLLDLPAHELISRTLFEIANGGQMHNKTALKAANEARAIIFQRLVGRRKPGSHPATKIVQRVEFVDLAGELDGA